MRNILFLDGQSTDEFYNRHRANYVTVCSIFKNNSIINRVLRRIFKKFKCPMFHLYGNWKSTIKSNKYDYIIINDNPYNAIIARDIRKLTESKIILWYWNPLFSNLDKINLCSCEYWSFDEKNSLQYNMQFANTYYFSDIKLPYEVIERDIYFIGADKGRLETLLNLKKCLNDLNITSKFHIGRGGECNSKNTEYQYDDFITYDEVLKEISKSKAILDIVQENQTGYTQRAMESIFFRKKLVTNSIYVVNADFYNSNNIFVLGQDDLNKLQDFLNKPYCDVDSEILKRYDFKFWLDNF